MIRNIIFDFGAVLVDWNPRYLYLPYFGGDEQKTEWFLTEVCPYVWNTTVDAGRDTQDAMQERIALYPEWEKEIRMYYGEWIKMMGGELPGMCDLLKELKAAGYRLYGLTNWSRETFPKIADWPVFQQLEGYVVSGAERIKKPDQRLYRILIERFGIDPAESIFIDDSQANLDGGEAVGIRGVLFESPEQIRLKLKEIGICF